VNEGYPAIPAEGTGVGPLVTVANYEQITGDTVNSNQGLIDEAITEVCQFCRRTLAYGTYTERLFVSRRGMAYPSALPLDPVAATLPESSLVQGPALWIGYWTPLPDLPVWTGVVPPQVDATYSGGYQVAGTVGGPTAALPPRLMRAICRLAWYLSNPVALVGVPAGATGVSLQGVSISGMSSPISSWENDEALVKELRKFERREIPAFGN
jgi:hypothetical protein